MVQYGAYYSRNYKKTKEINPGLNWYNKWPRLASCVAKKVESDLCTL